MVIIRRLLVVVYVIGLSLQSEAAGNGGIAKPGCETHCGNVSIPFPFGIGSRNCFLDYWFEIVCNKSTAPYKPSLSLTSIQVLNISVDDDTIQVRNPVSFWNCSGNETQQPRNLTGSPFFFSVERNIFTAVSCGVPAVISSSNLSDIEFSAGCTSKCSKHHGHSGSCNGLNCCQTTIPSDDVQRFTTSLQPTANRWDNKCKYTFVVDKDWFNSTDYVAIGDMHFVPVTISWRIYHSQHEVFGIELRPEDSASNYYCYEYPSLTSSGYMPRLTCYCSDGFSGNPYLSYGCQDIDECQSRLDYCRYGTTCVNTIGSFVCLQPKVKNLNVVFVGLGSGLGALFLLIGAWFLYKFIKKRKAIKRRKQFFKRNGGLLLQQQISSGEINFDTKTNIFNSKELQKATDNFNVDRILGQGGQGTVYKGMLTDGKIVAVKRSKIVDEGKLTEFINEVIILSQINHRNVVKLLGCCLETEVPLLVYEFIANGTLSEYIHGQNEEFLFTWETRLRIALEIAGALSYLHSAASFPIYHRDIKSSNILLDEKLRAKVADFGTSKSVAIDQTHVTTMVHGTFGYLDPEYFQTSQFTEKSDVYSFGVVIVELMTGQKPICVKMLEEGRSLAAYFIMCMEENCLLDIVDPQIAKEGGNTNKQILSVANLAKRCLNLNGRYRPTMKEVATELDAIQKSMKTCSNSEESYEEVEYVRNEITEPWDVSTTIGSNASTSSGVASSSDKFPLLSV